VTFAVGRDSAVYVDGTADTTLQPGGAQALDGGGTLAELSNDSYQLTFQNGESLAVSSFAGLYLNWTLTLGPNDAPGSVQGLLGSDTGQANDFALPNGTVLAQPLNQQQMLAYAEAWSVAPGTSLLNDSQASVAAQLTQAIATVPSAATIANASTQANDPQSNYSLYLAPNGGGN
jgi:hypothetical protein